MVCVGRNLHYTLLSRVLHVARLQIRYEHVLLAPERYVNSVREFASCEGIFHPPQPPDKGKIASRISL
jgi:hypothetical protein